MTTPVSEKPKFQEVVFAKQAHDKLLQGATILANAVGSTMGPGGQNVIIDSPNRAPLITKDGVTVARSIQLKDKLQRIGAELIYEVAQKTNDLGGDGTTTATVLGHGLLSQGIKMIATGRSPVELKKGMDLATAEVISFLKKESISVTSEKEIVSVGTISANGDEKIGLLLAKAIAKVGSDGIITCEPSKNLNTVLDIAEGMQFEGGYVSPFFITNNEKLICEFENPYVLVTNKKISALGDIVNILEAVHKTNRSLVIIGDEFEGEALHTLIVNKMKGVIKVCAVKAPGYGDFRSDLLHDISSVVGGQVFDISSETQLKNISLNHLGSCKKIIIGRNGTTIIGAPDSQKATITSRIESLRQSLSDTTIDAQSSEKLRRRLAKLAGGVAIVKVGGSTEVEILERRDRVEDALNATVAAAQEGIVPGGGTALFYASVLLRKKLTEGDWKTLSEDVVAGVNVVANACEMPLRTIVKNTGISDDVVVLKLLEGINPKIWKPNVMKDKQGQTIEWINPLNPKKIFKDVQGFDAANNKFVNLLEKGIIDPVKVTRYAIEHACSVVGLMLTTNCVIIDSE